MDDPVKHSTELVSQHRRFPRTLANKYLSAGEALALAGVFESCRQQLSSNFKIRLMLYSLLTKLSQFFRRGVQTPESQEAKCPDFQKLLSGTQNFSAEYYAMVQKRFGIDFHPNYLSKNGKLQTEIASYQKIAGFITKADVATINPEWGAQRERETNSAVRRNLLDLKTKLFEIDDKYKFQISAACIINNEARFLKEWLDFHMLVGIEHFFLFNNRSTDNYLDVLAPYIKKGTVDIINWDTGETSGDAWIHLETEALSSALRLARGRSKWLALIDTDEYLFPMKGESLNETLAEFEPYGSVSVRYTVFGTNSVQLIPADKLLIESLTKSCVDTSQHNKLFKSIVRPEFVDSCINSHYCELMPGFINVTEDFKPLNPETIATVQNKKLSLNHYWSRDLDYFQTYKLPRLIKWDISAEQCMRNLDELSVVERTDILRFVPKLKQRNES
jgi:Glycosyltransferase family 92